MITDIIWNEGNVRMDVPETEEGLWKEVGKILLDIDVPNTLRVKTPLGEASLSIGKRGTFVKDGVTRPSMYVVPSYNYISLPSGEYKDAYLTCVNPESNNYKFYWLRPNSSGIGATYGRIGSEYGERFGKKDLQTPYDTYLYWIRYYEKLSKGYVDMSNVYLKSPKITKDTKKTVPRPKAETVSDKLYEQLKSYARHVVKTVYASETVTKKQATMTKQLLAQLRERKTIKGFNSVLSKILQVSPRRARYISEMYARSEKDFGRIVLREESLYNAMSVMVGDIEVSAQEGFERLGIKVFEATDAQKEEVMKHLADGLENKVKKIYRVIPEAQQKAFDKYLKDNNIKKVKQYWHGSTNENWLSIIENGLQLNPNAKITGKMFGYGIYFAPRARKSFGYTSSRNSYWAHGSSNTAFMGLYATAFGKPYMVRSAGQCTEAQLKRLGYDCVFAKAENTGLCNDEIVYYNESAMVLNYIVEFEE